MISLCMIVKNEEKFIKQCIDSAIPLVDEIIIVDTGSTDQTMNIINTHFHDKVTIREFEWINDFSAARNESLLGAKGDWILLLDADEVLSVDKLVLLNLLEKTTSKAFNIPINNLVDNGLPFKTANMPRLFRREGAIYSGEIHEQLLYDGVIQGGDKIDSSVIHIDHYGYLNEVSVSKDKKNRNIELLKIAIKNDAENAGNWYKLGVTYISTKEYEKALNCFFEWGKRELDSAPWYYSDVVIRVATCLLELRNYKELEIYLLDHSEDKGLTSNPDYYCLLGQLYNTLGNNDKAKLYYSKAIELGEEKVVMAATGTGSFVPRYEMSQILLKEKKIDQGIAYCIDAVFCKENSRLFGLERLRTILTNKKKEKVSLNLNELLQQFNIYEYQNISITTSDKNKASELAERIELLINEGELEQAKKAVLGYEIFDERFFSIKGIINLIEGDYLSALVYFAIGLRFNEEVYDLKYNMAYTFESLQENRLALYYYRQCLEVAPFGEKFALRDTIVLLEAKVRAI